MTSSTTKSTYNRSKNNDAKHEQTKPSISNQATTAEQNKQTTSVLSVIRHHVLMTWALLPPQYNMLKPIDQLLTNVQTVFPPFANVKPHEYFKQWKPIHQADLFQYHACDTTKQENKQSSIVNHDFYDLVLDVNKVALKRAYNKLRLLLHPDRLPKDLDEKQRYICKLMWDVSNDAFEDFKENKKN